MPTKTKPTTLQSSKKEEAAFSEIVLLIAASREKALQAVNTALIELYWEVGSIISRKIAAAEWGDAIEQAAALEGLDIMLRSSRGREKSHNQLF